MTTWKILSIFFIWMFVSAFVDAGQSWFVSHNGNDMEGCGSLGSPCRSLAFTVPQTGSKASIFMHGDGKPYVHEQDDYIIVNKTLTITAWNKTKPEIACKSVLFLVVSDHQKVTLNLNNMTIKNCPSSRGAILVHNARVSINSCKMIGNGVVFHHPQNTMPGCNRTEIFMHESIMTANQIAKPFNAGIRLLGCDSLIISIQNTTMTASPIQLQAETSIRSTIINVTFDGTNLRTSSFDATLAKKSNILSFARVNVTQHSFTRNSPINICINEKTIDKPHINIKESRFFENHDMRKDGGVISLMARFQHDEPLLMNALISKCIFINNSARGNGGAINILNTKGLTITVTNFTDNQASNGAAISTNKASDILVLNSQFMRNIAVQKNQAAMASGGAIYSTHSNISLTNDSFISNSAVTSGSAISMEGVQSLQINQCFFEHTAQNAKVELIHAQSYNTNEYQSDPWVSIAGSTIHVTARSTSPNILRVNAPLSMNANTLNCSDNNPVRQTYQKPSTGNYNYKHIQIWCETCADGEHPNKDTSCAPCPDHTDCRYGLVIAHKNYWVDQESEVMEAKLCPPSLCNATDISACVQHRTGPLCMQCVEDFSPAIANADCIANKDCLETSKVLPLFLCCGVIYLTFILLLTLCTKKLTDHNEDFDEVLIEAGEEEEPQPEVDNSDDDKPLVGFSQTSESFGFSVSIVAVFFLQYQYLLYIGQQFTFHRATQWLADIVNMQVLLSAIPNMCNVWKIPMYNLLYTAATPTVTFVLWIIATIFRACSQTPKIRKAHSTLTGVLLIVIVICNAPMLYRSLEMFHCIPVGNSSVLYTQHGLFYCYQSWQYSIVAFSFLCVIPLFISIELAVRHPPNKVSTGLLAACPALHILYESIKSASNRCRGTNTPQVQGVAHSIYMTQRVNSSWWSVKSGLVIILLRVNVAVILNSQLSHQPMILAILLACLTVVAVFLHFSAGLRSLGQLLFTLETVNLFIALFVAIGNIVLAAIYEFNKQGLYKTFHVIYQILFFSIFPISVYIIVKTRRVNH